MKTQLLIFVLAMISYAGIASNNPNALIEKSKSITVHTAMWKSQTIHAVMRDEAGNVLIDETFENTKSLRKYNLKGLQDGNYVLELSNEFKIEETSFTIFRNEVIISPKVATQFKPVMSTGDGYLDVNLLNLGSNASISIADERNNVVFQQKLDAPAVHKRFDLSKLAQGDYVATIWVNNKFYTKLITR